MEMCFKRGPGAWLMLWALVMAAATSAARAGPPLDLYGHLPGLEMAALSPSGDRIALIGVVGDERRLIILGPKQEVLASSVVGNHKLRALRWAGEDRVMMNINRTVALGLGFTADKTELSSTMIIPLNGGKAMHVFANMSDMVGGTRGFYGMRAIDGRLYGYFGGVALDRGAAEQYFSNGNPNLYRVDLATGKKAQIAERIPQENSRDWVIGPKGNVVATLDFQSAHGDWTLRNADHKAIASGKMPAGFVWLMSLGRTDASVVYAVSDSATGTSQWFEQPLAGGPAEELLRNQESAGAIIDSMSGLMIGYVAAGDVPEEHFFDKHRERVIAGTRRAFPGLSVELVDWTSSFDDLIVRTEGPGDPGTWWHVDIKTGNAIHIGTSYAVAAKDVGPVRMYNYAAADGLAMGGVLTLPPGRDPRNLPVVVLPHGGPSARDYPTFDWWAQAFASRGYAVFQPNFRGSRGFGAAFAKAGHGEWGRKMQSDISDGLAHLADDGIVDPKRACIVGASYGGYAALAGVTLQHGLYRCAVSVAGVADISAMYRSDVRSSGGDVNLVRALKAELGSGRDLKLVSPVNFADRADAPILLIHGADDTVVLYSQSQAMERALKRAGKPVEFVTLAGEDHNLARSETRLTMLRASVAFVEKHNPSEKP